MSDDKSDEEESILNYCTLYDENDEEYPTVPTVKDSNFYSENICFFVSNLWNKREEHINTDYAVTGWMLCVITNIREDILNHSNVNHRIQVNTFINTIFADLSEEELHEGINTFWSEYTTFNHNIGPFDSK